MHKFWYWVVVAHALCNLSACTIAFLIWVCRVVTAPAECILWCLRRKRGKRKSKEGREREMIFCYGMHPPWIIQCGWKIDGKLDAARGTSVCKRGERHEIALSLEIVKQFTAQVVLLRREETSKRLSIDFLARRDLFFCEAAAGGWLSPRGAPAPEGFRACSWILGTPPCLWVWRGRKESEEGPLECLSPPPSSPPPSSPLLTPTNVPQDGWVPG